MPFIEVEPGIKVFVEDSCCGMRGTFVFIPGWPMSSKIFEYQFQHLVPHGYRCVALDLRGFGSSDKPWQEYGCDIFGRDLNTVLESLDLTDVTLVGHSMGGAIAMRYVATQKASRVKKLVLIGTAAPSLVQRPDFSYGIEPAAIEGMIQDCYIDRPKMLTRFGDMCFAKPVSAGFARWLHSIALSASPHATLMCLKALRDSDLRTDMAQIKIPTLILHGRLDRIAPFALAEVLHKGIKNSQLICFENSGHVVFYEDLAEFNQHLMSFA